MIMEAGRIERFLEGNRELLEKVCQAIRENPGGDYRMEAICRDFGISKHKLKTGFPKFFWMYISYLCDTLPDGEG